MLNCPNLLIKIALFLLVATTAVRVAEAQQESIQQMNQWIDQGQLDRAAQLARQLDEKSTSGLALPLARLARSLERRGEIEQAAGLYLRTLAALQKDQEVNLPAKTQIAMNLAAAACLGKSDQYSAAIPAVVAILELSQEQTSERQRHHAVAICLQVGQRALAAGDAIVAGNAYALALNHVDQQDLPTALLGDAWSAVLRDDQPKEAAKKLSDFCDSYTSHPDAHRAAMKSIDCYRQAGDEDSANSAINSLLERWPNSPSAAGVVRDSTKVPIDSLPESVTQWMLTKASDDDLEMFDASLCAHAVLVLSSDTTSAARSNLIRRLAKVDLTGRETTDMLVKLPDVDAESVASSMLALLNHDPELDLAPAAVEACTRWAARTSRWSMIVPVAELQQPDESESNRTAIVERLFAEAFMQAGRVEETKPWWNHLVDVRSVDDFSTLLRRAEAETATGNDTNLAQQFIDEAKLAAGDNALERVLPRLLEADLLIRRTKFDAARAILQPIADGNDNNASIRSRAQWLIGETYYLQHKFTKAIDAYRNVEVIAGEDERGIQWVSASLVQAGKSFEQLGRTREAALCYGNLLDRFPDSAHAGLASQRMAVLAPEQRHGDAPEPSQTIRR